MRSGTTDTVKPEDSSPGVTMKDRKGRGDHQVILQTPEPGHSRHHLQQTLNCTQVPLPQSTLLFQLETESILEVCVYVCVCWGRGGAELAKPSHQNKSFSIPSLTARPVLHSTRCFQGLLVTQSSSSPFSNLLTTITPLMISYLKAPSSLNHFYIHYSPHPAC